MTRPKVAIIGHLIPAAEEIAMPADANETRKLLEGQNFTRVVTPDGTFSDHLAYLSRVRGLAPEDAFNVWDMYPCAGLLLHSHLERNGFEAILVNRIGTSNESQVFDDLRAFAPDIIVLSTTFVLTRRHLTDIGKRLREELPDAWLVAGGHHVFTTLMHLDPAQRGQYLEISGFDAFIDDTQGETALLELCRGFPDGLAKVDNLLWRDADGSVIDNPRVVEANDINDTLIEFDHVPAGSVAHIRTARSCAFKCAFCSYPTIAGELALMDVENVITTLQKAKAHGVETIIFVDDTFNVPKDRFETLIDRMLEKDLGLTWYSFLRCQYIDELLVEKMARSGCAGVFLGVESGSDAMLKRMKKGAIIRFYEKGVKWLRAQGIVTVGSFITGFPGETEETVAETRRFIETSGLDYYFIQPFYYLHHTPIHKRAAEFGLKGNGLMWTHDTMNWRQAIEHINRMFLEIEGPVFINPDYTLWEIAYLRSRGLSLDEIRDYRVMINAMTRAQMTEFGGISATTTSRVA
jgi:p-methyltransferase